MTKGRSILLYLVDGTPTGILTAEIRNWTGHVSVAPRSRIAEHVKRGEVRRTGIYFLTGPDPDNASRQLVYIGESDDVGKRLVQHNKDESKDFWERACVVTSKDQNLTKAHVRYLESRLISIAQDAGRARLHNGTAPDYGYLPEADIADMEYFLDQIRLVLPTLGLTFLANKPKVSNEARSVNSIDELKAMNMDDVTVFELISKKHGVKARAVESNGEFIVYEGSTARAEWSSDRRSKTHYWRVHDQLCDSGALVVDEGDKSVRVFSEDTPFNSPSAAAAVINGRSANGRKEWKVLGTNQTYADWQETQLTDLAQEGEDES